MNTHFRRLIPVLLCVLGPVLSVAHAELMPQTVHTTEYPLKDKRMLITDEEVATMRSNIDQYATAKGIATTIITRADKWVAWSDADLRNLVPTGDVTRAFNVGTAGCPKCGKEIYSKGGTYPWILDPKQPFKVKCPVDGSTYPSNDYAAYYTSGLDDKSLLTGDYADDGRGWVGENGERYWFVAYANHWTLRNHVIPAVHYLGRAYLITGDKKYAQKAAVLLDRFAEVYPDMDYHPQSRYGAKQAMNGSRYEGKIVNWIWATGNLTMLAESYDYVWDGIDDESVPGKTSLEVRTNIEANLLEEGIRSYFNGKVRGNFGMHQKALVYAGLARQHGEQETWFDGLLNDAGSNYRMTGLNYALYNLVYRDGTPYETSPGYNFSWVVNITTVAETLERAGYEVYSIPKMRRIYDSVLDIINVGQFTPSLGDSGAVYGGMVGRDAFVYQAAYRAYKDPRFLEHLQSFGAVGEKTFTRFESLIYPPIESSPQKKAPAKSRLLDGYGMAILNNPSDTVSLSLYYGYRGGHGHMDRMHFELFANDRVMMPDTGYPDFMNAYVPGIYTWSKNTITHNTTTVDATMQRGNHPGHVNLFVDKGIARALDIDAAKTYGQTDEYRRRLMMIDFDDEHSYIIDCFTTKGGSQHDYSLHGPTGTFEAIGGTWSEPAKGTLAGEEVPLGYIYDDKKLEVEGYTGSYGGYHGSGFQHLTSVQRLQEGTAIGEWTHERDATAKLRIYQPQAASETFIANAQVSPVKHTKLLKYMIAREKGDDLESTFISVIEPFKDSPMITEVKILESVSSSVPIIEVHWKDAQGQIVKDMVSINTDKSSFVLERFENNKVSQSWAAGGSLQGKVTKVDPLKNEIHIALEKGMKLPTDIVGSIVHFKNDLRRTSHTITGIQHRPEGVILSVRDDLQIGHLMVTEVTATGLKTPTGLAFAPVYAGTYVADAGLTKVLPIQGVRSGVVNFIKPNENNKVFEAGQEVWILDVGPGDRMEIRNVHQQGARL